MEFDNTLQKKLAANEPAFGARAILASPLIIEVYDEIEMDFVWIDLEHIGPS